MLLVVVCNKTINKTDKEEDTSKTFRVTVKEPVLPSGVDLKNGWKVRGND